MTEEIKKCDCKEKAIKKLKEFTFIAGAVFVGSTLAILLSANILKPKCHCPCPIHQSGFMQPMPPAPMINHGYRSEFGGAGQGFRAHDYKRFRHHHNRMNRDFRPEASAPRDFGHPNDMTPPQPPVAPKPQK